MGGTATGPPGGSNTGIGRGSRPIRNDSDIKNRPSCPGPTGPPGGGHKKGGGGGTFAAFGSIHKV